jgi:beta-D-galactosyl-(1->4)-L-rhamnose phosphorylase
MYNHTTNNWQKEHLMQLDPRHTNVQQYLLEWMENWCKANPDTNVVRFTSMFYNFVWIWGADSRNPHLFTDWASYDFTVSPEALEAFEKQYGYALTSEDFINKGKLQPTHCPADARKLDYMAFINDFVISFGKQLVDIVHRYNKLAYVFYDDSWVGVEPCGERFEEFGFDGIIKCVFSGFEVRLCNSVKGVKTHELRLHPYLFPVGLGGAPTFMSGGDPTLEAKKFWNSVRRALLRAPIDRIGLGGYLHLTEDFLDFTDYIEKVVDEFRSIKSLHEEGRPYSLSPKIGILTSWGKLRAWTCSGHYHEHPDLDLINILESLSGLPFEVEFLSFEEIKQGAAKDFSVIINAGRAGSAWIGGSAWQEEAVVEALTEWVYHGGAFIGVNEPSAQAGYDRFFRMAHVLGVDKDTGERLCHGKWTFEEQAKGRQIAGTGTVTGKPLIYLTDGKAEVLMQDQGMPALTTYDFGKGRGMYLSSYTHSIENTRMLLNTILYATGESESQHYITDNCYVECAYYPESHKLVVINNSGKDQSTVINTQEGSKTVELMPYDTQIVML